jgi:hypothetical protein
MRFISLMLVEKKVLLQRILMHALGQMESLRACFRCEVAEFTTPTPQNQVS